MASSLDFARLLEPILLTISKRNKRRVGRHPSRAALDSRPVGHALRLSDQSQYNFQVSKSLDVTEHPATYGHPQFNSNNFGR